MCITFLDSTENSDIWNLYGRSRNSTLLSHQRGLENGNNRKTAHGPNTVISMLHRHFKNIPIGVNVQTVTGKTAIRCCRKRKTLLLQYSKSLVFTYSLRFKIDCVIKY